MRNFRFEDYAIIGKGAMVHPTGRSSISFRKMDCSSSFRTRIHDRLLANGNQRYLYLAHIAKLFDRYYRVDNKAMRFKGMGPGLFIKHFPVTENIRFVNIC